MSVQWPVDLVSLDTGGVHPVHTRAELNQLIVTGRYRLRRRTAGLEHVAVAAPSRAAAPRESSRRGDPAPEPVPEPVAEPEVAEPVESPPLEPGLKSRPRTRRSPKKG